MALVFILYYMLKIEPRQKAWFEVELGVVLCAKSEYTGPVV